MGWNQSQVEQGSTISCTCTLQNLQPWPNCLWFTSTSCYWRLVLPAQTHRCRPWSGEEHPAEAAFSPKRSATLEPWLCRSNLQGPQIKVLAQRRKTPAFRIWLVLPSVLRAFCTEFHLNVCFRMGNTCIPVVDSFWYLAKLIQLCKV